MATHPSILDRLRDEPSVVAVELRPPRAELASAASMDAWIDTYHAVRSLAKSGTPVFLTDSAVGLKEEDIRQSNRPVDSLLDVLLAGFTLPHTITTVLQDWMKGRHSEVDDLNGLVAREAARLGRAAPVNAAIAELAHRIEDGRLKPGLSNLPLLQELSGTARRPEQV